VTEAADEPSLQTPVAAVPTVSGAGWTTVRRLGGVRHVVDPADHAEVFSSLTEVSGHWGKGRLIQSELLSLLVTKNGRVFAGAVRPGRLYAAAAGG
jgi:hypothetical protein